jgi:hypothetical protein
MDLESYRGTMKTENIICMLFISLVLAGSTACLADNNAGPSTRDLSVPKEKLPEGFRLIAALPEMDPEVNMTDYIKDFYGAKDIGLANATVGIYQWGKTGEAYDPKIIYDAKITLIQLQDEEHANAAISNYRSQPTYQNLLARGLPIFGNATLNGHEALEIREIRSDDSFKYLYLWNTGSIVAFVEGNGNRNESLELASATGL